ncbi:MAG: SDR family oxidoreductase [Polyangiaceae bacterium]
MKRFENAIVVLTGAAGGIGRATTARLVERGAYVVAVDRDRDGLSALARLHGNAVTVRHADLANVDGIDALATSLADEHGPIDVLVHNAGLTVQGELGDMTAAQIDRVLDVDLRAPLQLTRALLPHLAQRGHVVFVSSMAAVQPFPTQSTYSAAKAGLRAFAEVLRIESRNLGVSILLPGTIATPFLDNAESHDVATTAKLAGLMRRFGTPPDRVARAIVQAVERNRPLTRVGWDCHAVSALRWLCPPLLPLLLRQGQRLQWLGVSRRSARDEA